MLKRKFLFVSTLLLSTFTFAQKSEDASAEVLAASSNMKGNDEMVVVKSNPVTILKDQARTGTCWSFSTTSLIESQLLKNKQGMFDISEMFTVRNIYLEKARNYILRQGRAQFDEGALGHDVIRAIATYGAMPESVYSGLIPGESVHDHNVMVKNMRKYLDSILKSKIRPIPANWREGFVRILDQHMGAAPENFVYNGKRYTPKNFASEVLKFSPDDYVYITSFTHQPYYKPFILEVPDNFSNGAYINIPLQEMIDLVKSAISNGYTVMWDADVSNNGFYSKAGLALYLPENSNVSMDSVRADMPEARWDERSRQQLFETLVTQDDHLMHLHGLFKTKSGKTFFQVKNSYGSVGKRDGFIYVSEAYFAMNTVSLVLPKAALNKTLLEKIK